MRRIITFLVLILVMISIVTVNVNKQMAQGTKKYAETKLTLSDKSISCDGILTDDGMKMVQEILGYIRIAGPILLVLLTALDFAQAVLHDDNDALKKATGKITKRAIATVALFFIPTIIRAIFNLRGVRDVLVIPNDPLCGTMESIPDTNQYRVG